MTTTISPEARADLVLLRQQTEEVRRAHHRAHCLASERQDTVIRLRRMGVTYRVIAAAMDSSIAAVQSILTRTGAAGTLGAGTQGVGMGVGVSGGVVGAGAVGLGATITTPEEARA